jgi:hypothetical protein
MKAETFIFRFPQHRDTSTMMPGRSKSGLSVELSLSGNLPRLIFSAIYGLLPRLHRWTVEVCNLPETGLFPEPVSDVGIAGILRLLPRYLVSGLGVRVPYKTSQVAMVSGSRVTPSGDCSLSDDPLSLGTSAVWDLDSVRRFLFWSSPRTASRIAPKSCSVSVYAYTGLNPLKQ